METSNPAKALLGSLLLLLVSSSCSSYEKAWTAAANPQPQQSHPLAGRWVGQWSSEGTGHQGKLRCIVSQLENAFTAGTLDFYFHARWGGIFSGTYRQAWPVKPLGNQRWAIQGDKDLGGTLGKFTHQSVATPDKLTATYKAMGDKGTFSLQRP